MSNLPLFKEFISYLKENNYSEATVYNYSRDLKGFENFLDKKNIAFQTIDKTIINDYKHYITSAERKTVNKKKVSQILSVSSANRALSTLRSYLKFLIGKNYNLPIPTQDIKFIRVKRETLQDAKSTNVKLKDQIRLIESPLNFEKNKIVALRNRAMLETLFSTSVRISELLNLKKDQINNSRKILIKGKKKEKRFVYLSPRAFEHLTKYLEARGKDLFPYLFIPFRGRNANKKSKKISPNYFQAKIKKYREKLGIDVPISARTLRYSFTTYLAEEKADPTAVQTLSKHESLNTTTRYVNPSDRYAEKTHQKYHPLKRTKKNSERDQEG